MNKFMFAWNQKCQKKDLIDFLQSSLKSYPLWVTLYKDQDIKIVIKFPCLLGHHVQGVPRNLTVGE